MATTKLPPFAELQPVQWALTSATNPTIVSYNDTTKTMVFSQALIVGDASTKSTGGHIVGVIPQNGTGQGVPVIFYIPLGNIAVDGVTATNVVPLKTYGTDLDDAATVTATLASGDPVFCAVSHITQGLMQKVVQGSVATGGIDLIMGTEGGDGTEIITIYRTTGAGTKKGLLRWDTSTTKVQFSNDGTAWTSIDDTVASTLVDVSSGDTTAGYLFDKLVAGNNVTLTKQNAGANENVLITAASQRSAITVHNTYTPAFLTGGTSPETNSAIWDSVSDASFRVSINGTQYDITALDLTSIASMADVAAAIQVALRVLTGGLETVTWSGTQFVITSVDTTSTSAVSFFSAVSPSTGTDISGAGSAYMDCDSGSDAVQVEKVLDPTADVGEVALLNADGNLEDELIVGTYSRLIAGEAIDGSTTPKVVYVNPNLPLATTTIFGPESGLDTVIGSLSSTEYFFGAIDLDFGVDFIDEFTLAFRAVGSPTGNVNIEIFEADSSGDPTGSTLANYTIDASTLTNASSPKDPFTFKLGINPLDVTSLTRVGWRVQFNVNASNYISISRENTINDYDVKKSSDGSSWSTAASGYGIYVNVKGFSTTTVGLTYLSNGVEKPHGIVTNNYLINEDVFIKREGILTVAGILQNGALYGGDSDGNLIQTNINPIARAVSTTELLVGRVDRKDTLPLHQQVNGLLAVPVDLGGSQLSYEEISSASSTSSSSGLSNIVGSVPVSSVIAFETILTLDSAVFMDLNFGLTSGSNLSTTAYNSTSVNFIGVSVNVADQILYTRVSNSSSVVNTALTSALVSGDKVKVRVEITDGESVAFIVDNILVTTVLTSLPVSTTLSLLGIGVFDSVPTASTQIWGALGTRLEVNI